MITKLTKTVDNSPINKVHIVRGYESAKLVIDIKSITGTLTVGIYVSRDSSDPLITEDSRAKAFLNGKQITSNYTISSIGVYEFLIDTSDVNKLQIIGNQSTGADITSNSHFSTSMYKLSLEDVGGEEKSIRNKLIQEGFGTYDVTAYESAKIILDVKSITGTRAVGVYKSHSISGDISERADAYIDGRLLTSNLSISEPGKYIIDVDVNDVVRLLLSSGAGTWEATVRIVTYYDKLDIESLTSNRDNIFRGEEHIEIPLSVNAKQIDFEAKFWDDYSGYLYLEGSNDDFETFSGIPYIDNNNLTFTELGYMSISQGLKILGFANVEGYKNVRFRFVSSEKNKATIKFDVHNNYITREIGNINIKVAHAYRFFRGYRWIEFDFSGTKCKGRSLRENFLPVDENADSIAFNIYDRAMNPIPNTYYSTSQTIEVYGDVTEGGVIIECEKPIYSLNRVLVPYNSLDGATSTAVVRSILYENRPSKKDFDTLFERGDYLIKQLPSLNTNKDVFNSDVLEYTSKRLSFYMYGYHGIRYDIPFTVDNVPSLQDGETIKLAYLLPINLLYRNGRVGSKQGASRIVVFTNKGRILHNFPVRNAPPNPNSDMFLFDESAVINLYQKWQPVNSKELVDSSHKYFPVLKDYDYSQFNGRVAGTEGFVDHFGNGGLPVGKMYLQSHVVDKSVTFSALTYSNISKGDKMTVFGNYNSSEGSEPFVMATNDGGRTWYIQAWFACTDHYNYMRGGSIDLTPITSTSSYVANSIRIGRKRFNIPTSVVKEPITPFVVNESDKSLVTNISLLEGETVITLADDVDYDGSYPVVYFENVSADSEWDYICNNGFTADGEVNNGIFFRVKKIAPNQYQLFADLGNQYEGDQVCRHIHAVNMTTSGVIISTGESYSDESYGGGFLYYLQQNFRNGGNVIALTSKLPIIRLTSAKEGVNRACGAYLFNDEIDPTLLYVSDEAFETIENGKRYATIEGRSVKINNTPAGIFIGKLSDIDDQSKFKCICESKVTILGLTEHHGHFVADGHVAPMMVSKNGYDWTIETESSYGNKVNGTDENGNIYFGNKVIVFK